MRKASLLITIAIGLLSNSGWAQEAFKGEWMGRFENNKIWLSLKVSSGGDHSTFGWSVDLHGKQMDGVKGLPATQSNSDTTPVHFELIRDAGTVVFDGMVRNGSGIGDYQFTPSQEYISAIRAMGYDNLSREQLLRLALRDVSRGFIKEMSAAGYQRC